MKKLTFLELAKKVLEEEEKPLSAEEIWTVAQEKSYDKEIGTKGKTPVATIAARIYIDIRDNKDSNFIKLDSIPKRFYLHGLDIPTAPTKTNIQLNKNHYLEKDLHPFLAYFVSSYLRAYTKTIHHEKAGKKEFGQWVHPDMIGCYFPFGFDEWKLEVFEFSSLIRSVTVKFFSFEIKIKLSFANLRESFFQTVSNSSWANESYLVASNISQDIDFLSELRRLSVSFGVGVISLNINDPDSSEILFSAKNREYLDWDMINKLTAMNPSFKEFLVHITKDITIKTPHKEWYDKVLSSKELIEVLNKKKINKFEKIS